MGSRSYVGDTSTVFHGWINLPADICNAILDLLGAFDVLSFPLVCKPWAAVYAKNRRLQPGAPTLITSPSDDGWEIPDDYERGLFSITNILSSKVFSVEVESLAYGRWIGGRDEWLVITNVGATRVQLLNPITKGCCIDLPDHMAGSFDRVQLCRTPDNADGYFAIAISLDNLSYTMVGCDRWITLENPDRSGQSYCDAIMHRGNIVAICQNGDLWSWDLDQGGRHPKLLMGSFVNTQGWARFDFILAPSLRDNILIVSPYGEDLPIRMGNTGPSHSNQYWNFIVHGVVIHELDNDAQSIAEVRDIGDHALLLGPNYPLYVPVSVPTGDLKRNCLYIAALADHDVVAIDLSLEDIPRNVSLTDYAGLSNPYQAPMWFRPAFP
ncbi:uncharacterized protein [Lolium perenne]|uniref:uncharacterized protein n=1 Tax=Lolium perenne TaxID=4522 RepID=UPI003A98E721